MLTIQPAQELRGTSISVNSLSPGFLTGAGTMTPEKGARLPVRFALDGDESGRFVEPDGETPW